MTKSCNSPLYKYHSPLSLNLAYRFLTKCSISFSNFPVVHSISFHEGADPIYMWLDACPFKVWSLPFYDQIQIREKKAVIDMLH